MAAVFISYSSADAGQAASLTGFLKGRSFDSAFLDRDEQSGILPAADWKRELFREVRACEIMVVLWSKSAAESRWCFFERTLASTLGKRFLPVLLDDTPLEAELAATSQAIPRSAPDRWERVARGLEGLAIGSRAAFPWPKHRAPYPGLMSFDTADARVFFGREREVQAVLDIVSQVSRHERGGWVVLVGPSGCGKSSILRAGVLARLALDKQSWIVSAPVRAGELASGKLDSVVPPAASGDPRTLVVALDQLEELFDENNASEEVDARLARLRDWARSDRVVCLATLRADFHAHFQRLAAKLELRFRTQPIEAFPLKALERVIHGPAEVAALDVDPTLAAELLRDASPDSLPLLAFTLREIYERGDRRSMSRAVYDALGGIEGAAAQVADRVLASHGLDDVRRARCMETLLRLVRVNEQDEPIRRSLPKSEIPAELAPLFEDLLESRLLVVGGGTDPAVELSHEALIIAWQPLRELVKQAREFLVWHRRLQVFMDTSSSAQGNLLHDDLLSEALSWVHKHPSRLNAAERDLIARSEQAYDIERNQKLRDAQELAQTKESAFRRALIGLAAAICLGVVAIVFAIRASQQTQLAEGERRVAEGERKSAQEKAARLLAYSLAQASDEVLWNDRELALLLALEAHDREQSVTIRRRIYAASEPAVRTGGHWGEIVAADWSPTEKIVATGSKDGSVRLWKADGSLERILVSAGAEEPEWLEFSRSGRYLAVLSEKGTVRVWSRDGATSVTPERNQEIKTLQWSPTTDVIALASSAGLGVYDARGERVTPWIDLDIASGFLSMPGPFFSPDGARIATGTRKGVHIVTLGPVPATSTIGAGSRVEFLRWLSPETLLVPGWDDAGSAIVRVDGSVLWRNPSNPGILYFFVDNHQNEFLTGAPVSAPGSKKKSLAVHDLDGRKLREIAWNDVDSCVLIEGGTYCANDAEIYVNGARLDFRVKLSSLSSENGRFVIAGVTRDNELCVPDGRGCQPLARIPELLRDDSDEDELPFALGHGHALIGKSKFDSGSILNGDGTESPLEGGGELQWMADGAFVVTRTHAATQHAPDGDVRGRFDTWVTRVAPSGSLVASLSRERRAIVIRDVNGVTRRTIEQPAAHATGMSWGTHDGDFCYETETANFILDPLSSAAPTELPPGDLRWSPNGRRFAIVSPDFNPFARRGALALYGVGGRPAVTVSAASFSGGECRRCDDCPECTQHAMGWSPGGRYFAVCVNNQGLGVEAARPDARVKIPCELEWSSDDAWYIVKNSVGEQPSLHSVLDGELVRDFSKKATVAWSPKEPVLAVLEGTDISFWSPPDELRNVVKVPNADGKVSFSPTGEHLMWYSGTRGVMVHQQKRVKEFYFPGAVDEKIAWSFDGALVAAGPHAEVHIDGVAPSARSALPSTYVLNQLGELVAQLAGAGPTWSKDGQRLALTVRNEQRIWNLSEEAAATDARRFVSRALTSNERQRFGLPEVESGEIESLAVPTSSSAALKAPHDRR